MLNPRVHLGIAAALLLAGCSFSTIAPAHKLDSGEIVVQGAIDEPGFLFIPRLSAAVTYGLGGAGDIGAHAGTTGFTVNGGATARLYTGKHSALSVQGDIFSTTFEEDLFTSGTRLGIVTLTPRFGRVLSDRHQQFYGGAQGVALLPFRVEGPANAYFPSSQVLGVGAYLGYAFDSEGDWDIQLEVSGAPFGLLLDGESVLPTPLPIAQLGLAVQHRKERGDKPAPSPTEPPQSPRDNRIY